METDNGETFWTNRSPQTYSDGQISVKTPGKDTILDVKAADLLFIREIDRLIQVTFTSQIVSFPFSHWDLPSETTYSFKSCPSVFRRLACVQTFNLFYWTFFCLEATAYISAPGDAELMHKMKETIDNQRDSIRSKNMEIDSLRKDLEAVRDCYKNVAWLACARVIMLFRDQTGHANS